MTLTRAASELQAANGALAHLGETLLSALTERRTAARAINDNFGQVRDELLRAHDWNFAKTWEVLAADPTARPGQFSRSYPLPSNCLRVRSVDGASIDEWCIEGGLSGDVDGEASAVNVLSTDLVSPRIGYTARIGEPQLWDATFLAAFEFALAAKLAPLLGRDDGLAETMRGNLERILARAKRQDAREAAPSRTPRDGRYVTTRFL
jgi:hypothetical protein